MSKSTFGRLFSYARTTKADALENFTTEALAAAIRDEPEPFVQVLRSHLLVPSADLPIAVVPATQVSIPGTGILDLVVDLRYPNGTQQTWFEVKVMAGESGSQLANYTNHLSQLPVGGRPRLVILGRTRFGKLEAIPFISWQTIWRAAGSDLASSKYWTDLRAFLEEIHMADTLDTPVTAIEAASLQAAGGLLGKTSRILAATASAANQRWPTFRWPAEEGRIQATLASQFARHRRYLIVAGLEFQAYLFMGVISIDAEAHATVWVETRNKAIEPRRRIIEAGDKAGLGSAWQRDLGAWGGLHKSERLVLFATHEAAAEWFIASLAELDSAGVLGLIPTLGHVEPTDQSDDEDGELV
jgi:hypothetical protein